MNYDRTVQIRILRHVVEEFISTVKNYHSCEVPHIIDLQMLFREIVKRKHEVGTELHKIARRLRVHLTVEGFREFQNFQSFLTAEIKIIMQMLFSQDLLEIALNADENFNISEEKLLDLLYYVASREEEDIFTYEDLHATKPLSFWIPSAYEPAVKKNRTLFSDENIGITEHYIRYFFETDEFSSKKIGYVPPQSAGQQWSYIPQQKSFGYKYRSTLRDPLPQDFSYDGLKNTVAFDSRKIASTSKLPEHSNVTQASWYNDELPNKYGVSDICNTSARNSETERLTDITNGKYRSWEDCLGRKFLHEHIYISEASSTKTAQAISATEFSEYSNILNTSDSIPEDTIVHNILDVLTGTPSDTFCFDIHARKFRIKSGIHLSSMSAGCFANMTAKFLESGSMYYALQKFSRDILHAVEGSIFKGLQLGVQQVLSIYKEYIEAVKVNFPTIQSLRKDVLENADLLLSFGVICGINPEQMIITEIPKGLALLSYLHRLIQSHPRKEIRIMIAVLLKFAYAPYFRFLNEWMSEGVCIDPHNEFHIVEDSNYLGRRDHLFWKFAYTENIDDRSRSVPPQLKVFSQGILDCGKSIKLLKYLSPYLSSLKFFSSKSPPCFSMVYSYPAILNKVGDCMDYIIFKENESCMPRFKLSDVSIDKLYLESQKLVDEKIMVELVKRRYDIIFAANTLKSNIVDFKMMSHDLLKDPSNNSLDESSDSSNKCECLIEPVAENKELLRGTLLRNVGLLFSASFKTCLHQDNFKILSCSSSDCKDSIDDFSGKLCSNVGLLFSSCGYIESDSKSNNLMDTKCKSSSLDFTKQLCISSYTHYPSVILRKKMPLPNLETLNLFSKDNVVSRDIKKEMSEANYSVAEEAVMKDILSYIPFPSSITTRDKASFASNDKNKNSFMDKLASFLVSEYGDSIADIYSYLEVVSLEKLLVHNFQSVLTTRIFVVEKAIMKCIVKEYQLDTLLYSLQNIYFLQDETFSQSLCEPLFAMVMGCKSPREFANWAVLNDMLVNAISDSDYKYNSFLFSLDMNIGFLPQNMPIERTDFLRLIIIECNVKWPLNIIVHRTCIQQYLKIFSMLLEIEFLCWLLGRTWKYLIMTSKELHLDDSPQFRVIMLNRFEMEQFIRVIRNSIHQHLQGPIWEFLEKGLSAERSSIDDLENIHLQYLEKVLARCFLTDETDTLHQLLSTMLQHIYKICSTIHDCEWQKNAHTGHYETYTFKGLNHAFAMFKQYQNVFLKCIMKESLTKKFGRHWDKDYQDFLETILTIGKNIS